MKLAALFNALISVTAMLCLNIAHAADAPAVGSAAPNFKLQDQNGQTHTLDEYKGKWLALYFYPKDNTPGCTSGKEVRANDWPQARFSMRTIRPKSS